MYENERGIMMKDQSLDNCEHQTQWDLVPEVEVTTAELDAVVKELKEARLDYDMAYAVSSDKHANVKKLETKLVDLLTAAGKSSYIVEKVALVSIVSKTQVTTPKSIEDKQKFFNWLEQKLGKDGLLAFQTINHQTLNSLYNQELAKAVEKGEDFNVPGIELPTVVKTLSMRAR